MEIEFIEIEKNKALRKNTMINNEVLSLLTGSEN